jgi:DNA-binding transcriptional MerR regulator
MANDREATPGAAGSPPEAEGLLSIGDLADAAGIAPNTIRAWERRYGRPQAVRLPSGHRRYTPADVRWLRRMAEALARGHRPSEVVGLPERELDDLLAPRPAPGRETRTLGKWLRWLREGRLADLRRELAREAEVRGPRAFLRERLAPLLGAVGRAWADGEIAIRHEHALTEIVEDLLRAMRDRLPAPRGRPAVVLATLPGEQHGLGLQMAALECARCGVTAHLLGPDVPLAEIAAATAEAGAAAVLLSVSLATGGVETDRLLADLRGRLPADVPVLVGGAGARGIRRGPRGIQYAETFDDLERWLEGLGRRGEGGGR